MTQGQMVTRPVAVMLVAVFLFPTMGVSQTGTIVGTVRVEGHLPAPRLITVTKNQDVCGKMIGARVVLVENGRVAFAIASLKGIQGATLPTERLLSNSECQFNPPVMAAAVGDTLAVDNQDDVLHNTHLNLLRGKRSRAVGNWALSRKGVTIRAVRPLRRAGMIDVECDAHSWMHATIVIFDHPYFSSTDSSGEYRIDGVPVGTHTVKVWHEVFGELEQEVTVSEGTASAADFVFSATSTAGKQDRNP